MDELRGNNKEFHNKMITKHQKMHGKYSIREKETSGSSDDIHPGETEEDIDEEIVYEPPVLGLLRGGDKWITLPSYKPTHPVGAKVMSCAILYEHLGWKTHEGVASVFGKGNSSKVCAFHKNQQGNTIEECLQLNEESVGRSTLGTSRTCGVIISFSHMTSHS